MHDNFTENLKVILWLVKREHNYKLSVDEAVGILVIKTGIEKERIWQLLRENRLPDKKESDAIAKIYDLDVDIVTTGVLINETGVEVLKENMRYLLDTLPHGGKKELAEAIGKDGSTLQRWRSGETAPRGKILQKLHSYFQLDGDEDLKRTPLFLSLEPIGVKQKKDYCIEQIKEMSVQDFSAVYHALDKLIK